MAEQDQKSVTIGDILDQLAKPSVTQPPVSPPSPIQSKTTIPQPPVPPRTDTPMDIKLPQLGKQVNSPPDSINLTDNQPAKLRLSIRTMSADLATLKKGQKPSSLQVEKDQVFETNKDASTPKILSPDLSSLPQRQRLEIPTPPNKTPTIPPTPPIVRQPIIRPPITRPLIPPSLAKPTPPAVEPQHHHSETIISTDSLPEFLGAPLPSKKAYKPEEKVEYGLIARIISSGMTTGIISTIVVAIAIYLLLSFFVFNQEEIITTPTPTQTPLASPLEINELENIFRTVSTVDFSLGQDPTQNLQLLKSFVIDQNLSKKEFRKINVIPPSQTSPILNFTDLLSSLSVSHPTTLKDAVRNNKIVLLYGQEEIFNEPPETPSPKRLVFIVEILDIIKAAEIMREWEKSISNDLSSIFNIDPTKQASQDFIDNEHQGIKIRYKNFPLPDKSIDYAIASSLTGRHYLIITSSRESMYSPLNKIRGL